MSGPTAPGPRIGLHRPELSAPRVDAIVVGCYEDLRPIKGLAGELDWLLCGAFSSLMLNERFIGRRGDAALFTSRGKVPARKLLLIGRGPSAENGRDAHRSFGRTIATTLAGAGIASALIAFETPSASDDEADWLNFRQGLEEGAGGKALDLTVVAPKRYTREQITRLLT